MRELGLLPRSYQLNHLGESEKRHIRRLTQKLKRSDETLQLLEKPGKYISALIKSGRAKKLLKEKGYAVLRTQSGSRVFAERQHSKRLSYRESDDALIRTFDNRRSITYPLDTAPETLRRLERFFRTKRANQFLTFRVGDKAPFNIAIHSLGEMEKYLNKIKEEWANRPDSPGPYLQIVEVTDFEDDDE